MANGIEGYPKFEDQVALGIVPGFQTERHFGMNNDVPSTGSEELWPPGTARVLPTATSVANVVSDDDADNGATATGALTITLRGLDANWQQQNEVITLDGTTPVNGTKTWQRINRAEVTTAGSGAVNAGNISVDLDSGKLQAYVEASEGQSHQTHFTVPGDRIFLVTNFHIGVGRMTGSTDIQIQSQIKPFGNAWRTVDDAWMFGPETLVNSDIAFVLPPKCEVRQVITSSSATQAFSSWNGYMLDTNMLKAMGGTNFT